MVLEVGIALSQTLGSSDDYSLLTAALCALVAHKQNVAKQVHGAYTHEPMTVGPPQIRSVESYEYLASLS